MLLKPRTESDELLAMRALNTRMELSEKEKYRYLNLERGYEGEVKFGQMAEGVQEDRYILNDLFFEVNHSFFQIDTLIISQVALHLIEIKNHQGDWYFDSDKFCNMTNKKEYTNPLAQLKRCVTLFNQLLQNNKLSFLVQPSILFINPEFTLYQAPIDQPIILPTQANRFKMTLIKLPPD